ncbi:MAG: signal peptide peptidase SppA [Candidatus Eisenbacteria bacterium]|nr:signal peptide peptidase SppA [Candidatus Eisenbacteria bacterium]
MSARRRFAVALIVLAALASALVMLPYACLRSRTPAQVPVVLRFDVPSEIEECESPARPFSLAALRPGRPTLYDIERAIRHAALDDHVRALVLHIDSIDWGWARIAEVRDAVRAFRHTGKPVYVALAGGGEREYLLASAANRICAPPTAMIALDGLAASALFFHGSLEKLGVSPNFAHAGAYKSASETYTRDDLSPPAREALDAVLEDDWTLLVDSLASSRHLSADSVRRLIDNGPFDAADARAAGLVDTLMYEAEVDSMARRRGTHRLGSISLPRYLDGLDDGGLGARIALVVASGSIAEGRSRESGMDGRVIGSETLIEALRDARTRRSVRAIVLRIDSPGGSGQASDDIWREVQRCRREKPLIVSMGDYAASGGYYIAMGAGDILAEPATLTGSIGVFGGKFNLLGLLHKLGIGVDTVTRGRHALMLSPFSDFSDEEAKRFQRHLESFYGLFLQRVATGRHMTIAGVDSVAQGRVWTGRAAVGRGLVDQFGGLEEAILLARRRAHIAVSENVVVELSPRARRDFLSRMLSGLWNDDHDSDALALLPSAARAWIASARFPAGTVLALIPFQIDVR